MKRVQSACICQTLRFFQKDEIPKTFRERRSKEELEIYKKSLKESNTVFRILEETPQEDGSIVIKIIKQYNDCPIGDYLK